MSSVTICMMVRDDLDSLKYSLPNALEFGDEVHVLDTGSSDGTLEFLKDTAKTEPRLRVLIAPPAIIPSYGFAVARNLIGVYATTDWLHYLDADERISSPAYREILDFAVQPVIEITTLTYDKNDQADTTSWDTIRATAGGTMRERHRRIYRRDSGVKWGGYIHEEPFLGVVNAARLCQRGDIVHQHFKHYRPREGRQIKNLRYAWMIKRAIDHPVLQSYTNGYWYQEYYPLHKDEIDTNAAVYDELQPDGEILFRFPNEI
ncbi:MAG: glycosyltransferase [Hyphomicrobiaceae bacterium]|nr:MAG: glycosyltransferase [Hyphomicrobiaceae bacterium]